MNKTTTICTTTTTRTKTFTKTFSAETKILIHILNNKKNILQVVVKFIKVFYKHPYFYAGIRVLFILYFFAKPKSRPFYFYLTLA